jgi:hypothetical protein
VTASGCQTTSKATVAHRNAALSGQSRLQPDLQANQQHAPRQNLGEIGPHVLGMLEGRPAGWLQTAAANTLEEVQGKASATGCNMFALLQPVN